MTDDVNRESGEATLFDLGWHARDGEVNRLLELLRDLREYTAECESTLAPWIATRPGMVQLPDGWQSLRTRLEAELGQMVSG